MVHGGPNDDTKVAGKKITVVGEIGIKGIVQAAVKFIFDKTAVAKDTKSTTGDRAHAATTGYRAHAATTGYGAHAATTGYEAHAATTGDRAHAATTGYLAHAATTGYRAHAATTGDRAHAATTGYGAHAAVSGDQSIAAALGIEGRVKGALGSFLVCADWRWNGRKYELHGVKTAQVDGETILPDTWYEVKDGEFVRCEE